jgi:hypothetical protein
MHSLEIPGHKILKYYPSCPEELNEKQLESFIRNYTSFLNNEITGEQFRIRLAWDLLDLKKTVRYHKMVAMKKTLQQQAVIDQIHSNIYKISESLNSFFEDDVIDEKPVKVLRYNCIKQLLPKIAKYYGPTDCMQDSSFWEYKEAHTAFVQYTKSQDEKDLFRLAAILYRPRKSFFSIRKILPFYDGRQRRALKPGSNPVAIEKRAKKMAKAPAWKIFYVYLFFSSVENYLLTGRPVIDGKQINLSVLYEGTDNGENIGLTGILYSLAETNVFGDIDKTADAGLFDVIARLYQVATMYKKTKPKENDTDQGV